MEVLTAENQPTFLTFSCTGSPLYTVVRVKKPEFQTLLRVAYSLSNV